MRLLASFRKELTLLLRDRAGLALLFLMPTALVLVITLVQNNVMDSRSTMDVLLANHDEGRLGRAIDAGLRASEFFEVRTTLEGAPVTSEALREAVAAGRFQLGVIVHPRASEILEDNVELWMEGKQPESRPTRGVSLVLDPALQDALAGSMENVLELLVQREAVRLLLESLSALLDFELPDLDSFADLPRGGQRLVAIDREQTAGGGLQIKPNAVQHNVPAWAMFGIFFIVMPISGSLLRERREGTLARLFTIPVSFPILLLGKVLAYLLVNLLQLALMLWIGVVVLPWFGTPALELGHRPDLILAVGLCASLAATGFGLMLGTLARTYEQASTFGPISIIIAAALGGIMVPVFLMPRFMQPFSALSPLRWGHEAFLDLFTRGAGPLDVIPNMIRLLLFFLGTLGIALTFLFRQEWSTK